MAGILGRVCSQALCSRACFWRVGRVCLVHDCSLFVSLAGDSSILLIFSETWLFCHFLYLFPDFNFIDFCSLLLPLLACCGFTLLPSEPFPMRI